MSRTKETGQFREVFGLVFLSEEMAKKAETIKDMFGCRPILLKAMANLWAERYSLTGEERDKFLLMCGL